MARVEISGDDLNIYVEGLDRLWSLRSHLQIPLAHVAGAESGEKAARGWNKGLRLGGTSVPGVITAGSFYRFGEGELAGWTFWDVHKPEQAVLINLEHEHFRRLVIGVEDPVATIDLIRAVTERS